jgi:uncharacterized membrane protein YidH (DUF202 family)
MRVDNLDTVASLLINVIAYSVIAYAALRFRNTRLFQGRNQMSEGNRSIHFASALAVILLIFCLVMPAASGSRLIKTVE